MKKNVYNLQFRPYCNKMEFAGYHFSRVSDYKEKFLSLHHNSEDTSEFHILPKTGTHNITAMVEYGGDENSSVLDWSDKNSTALDDILLLLSLFTLREVFSVDNNFRQDIDGVLHQDPREWPWGGGLSCSLPFVEKKISNITGGYYKTDIGLENGINKIYQLISSEVWKSTYQKGYYLILAHEAFQVQNLKSSFILCWTIWEHLFSILNHSWMSKVQIRKMPAGDKIAFILVNFKLLDTIDKKLFTRISNEFVNTRNRLIHYGQFPQESDKNHSPYINHAKVFVRLTETIIAKSLGLNPSNVFNTKENLDAFKKGNLALKEFVA